MKLPRLLLLSLILLAVCLLAACSTTTNLDPLTGKAVSKVTVPDKDFTVALATAAGLAAKEAATAYIATHQPTSAVSSVPALP